MFFDGSQVILLGTENHFAIPALVIPMITGYKFSKRNRLYLRETLLDARFSREKQERPMKSTSFCLLIVGLVMASCHTQGVFNSCQDRNIHPSIKGFLDRYYNDYSLGKAELITKYFVLPIKEEHIEHLANISKIYRITGIEILGIKILSEKPLTVEVVVKEWYKPEVFPPPYYILSYRLRSDAQCNWKIGERGEPGVP